MDYFKFYHCKFAAMCLGVLLFVSCSSVRYVEIETYFPANITFPPEVKTLLVVNNSAQQPDNIGHRYIGNGKEDSIMSVSADSTAFDFCYALGKAIAASPVFKDVRLCEDTIRRDSIFYDAEPLSRKQVSNFCDDYNVDAILSLDELVFNTKLHEVGVKGFLGNKILDVSVLALLRVQWPGQERINTVQVNDSLEWYWEDGVFSEDWTNNTKDLKNQNVSNAMRYLASVKGESSYVHFVPNWKNDNRWYYTDMSSKWKYGTAYAVAEKWDKAAVVWEELFNASSKWKTQARLSSNLALCYELTGNFDKSLSYAEKSYQLFKENAGENDAYTKMQKVYLDVIKNRIELDKLLSKQLREN